MGDDIAEQSAAPRREQHQQRIGLSGGGVRRGGDDDGPGRQDGQHRVDQHERQDQRIEPG
ncbi:hypothetical protein [Brachybacterium alimentarium]|uniref:hypothetical protein n=1 Tax=Brachybacterium alimentarium TaxID=47845 RepID=UPI003FD5565B